MKINTYTAKGIKGTPMDLPKDLLASASSHLLAQALRVYEDNTHPGLSKVKTRAEVVGSRRKIWAQKGSGRARHGAISAPIFVGGGKAHGPKGVKRHLTLPKKMRQKALGAAFDHKGKEKEILVINNISTIKKTKDAAKLLEKIIGGGKRATIALSTQNKNVARSFRNIEKVQVVPFSGLNARIVYHAGILVVDKESFAERKESQTVKKGK